MVSLFGESDQVFFIIQPSSLTPDPFLIGAHMSIAGGIWQAVDRACEIGATALQIFLKNSNQWRGKPLSTDETERFRERVALSGIAPPIAHAGYLINLASPDAKTSSQSAEALRDELERANSLDLPGVVLHPGAHLGQGETEGLRQVAERINRILDATKDNQVAIYLETTAGQGTCLGYRFEQLAEIIDQVENKRRVAVCLDTCHVFAAGYPIHIPAGVDAALKNFDETIGLDRLAVIHVNDSKKPFGSHRDRHEHIGQGEMGEAGFLESLT
jgi:deoxyribonuclease-4